MEGTENGFISNEGQFEQPEKMLLHKQRKIQKFT